jgi:hypothetical protein
MPTLPSSERPKVEGGLVPNPSMFTHRSTPLNPFDEACLDGFGSGSLLGGDGAVRDKVVLYFSPFG